jgi:hypothetical protein
MKKIFLKKWIYLFIFLNTSLLLAGCSDTQGQSTGLNDQGDSSNNQHDIIKSSKFVSKSILPTNDIRCPNGGILLTMGIDSNGNTLLDNSEITQTEVVCHGVDGAKGEAGVNGVAVARGVTGARQEVQLGKI